MTERNNRKTATGFLAQATNYILLGVEVVLGLAAFSWLAYAFGYSGYVTHIIVYLLVALVFFAAMFAVHLMRKPFTQ